VAAKEKSDKKKYFWSILYLVLVIVGHQLAGIGGFVAGVIIAFGIHRTCRNETFSKTKKWIYSILYVIGGVIIGILVYAIVLGAIDGLMGKSSGAESSASRELKVLVDKNDSIPGGEYSAENFVFFTQSRLLLTFKSDIPSYTCLMTDVEFEKFKNSEQFSCLEGSDSTTEETIDNVFPKDIYYYLILDPTQSDTSIVNYQITIKAQDA